MDPDSGKLYTREEVEEMTAKERAALTWISRREYNLLSRIDEDDRAKALKKIRAQSKAKAKKRRKAQRKSRKKNR